MPEALEETFAELEKLDGKDALAVSAEEGRALYELVKDKKPKTILEVGTGHGYSTTWMALAMKENAVLFTLDNTVRPHLFDQPNFATGKNIVFIEGRLDERYDQIPAQIDFAFLDSQHHIDDVVYDVEAISPNMPPGGVVVVHDTVYREDMGTALEHYFLGIASENLKLVDVKPSKVGWIYRKEKTQYGLGVAIKLGKGKS